MVDSLVRNVGLVCSNIDGGVTLCPPFLARDVAMIPGLLPIFLHGCEIKSGGGLGTRLINMKPLWVKDNDNSGQHYNYTGNVIGNWGGTWMLPMHLA